MNLVFSAVVAGVLGTVAMDVLNHLVARTGLLSKIDVATIGRMAVGWSRGRFFYAHPSEMKRVKNELLLGYFAHYAIGICLAIPYVFGWKFLVGGPASPVWALVYGLATTVASWCFVYPSMGFGVFGRRSPEGLRAPISSLANHLFYAVGLAVGIVLV